MRKRWANLIGEIEAGGVVFRYVEGSPISGLALEQGINRQTLRRLLVEKGCKIRGVGRPEHDVETARRMRLDGATFKEIGYRLGVTRQAAHQLLRRWNGKG